MDAPDQIGRPSWAPFRSAVQIGSDQNHVRLRRTRISPERPSTQTRKETLRCQTPLSGLPLISLGYGSD